MIVLVHENHDKRPNLHQSNIFAVVLKTQILYFFSVVPNIYKNVYFFEYEHLNDFVWKDDNILAC